MNCCNEYGDCRQGRDCPASVAKVKRAVPKYPKAAPQGQYLRRNMRHLAKWMLIAIAVIFGTVIASGLIVGGLIVGGNMLAGCWHE